MITAFAFFVVVAVVAEGVAVMAQIKSENWTPLMLGLATVNFAIASFSTLFFIWKKICRKEDDGHSKINDVQMENMVTSPLL